MSYESGNYLKGLNPDDFISAGALDPNLVGPILPPIPPFTLPTGPTGSTGPTDIGPQPVKVFDPNPVVAPATVTWTSTIPGNPVARSDAISLFITPGITQSAVYSVFISTEI